MVSNYFMFLSFLFFILVLYVIYYSIPSKKPKKGILSDFTQDSEAQSLAPPSTSNSDDNIEHTKSNLPLSQYHIFSSWNSACSGQFVSTQQIQNVLTTGCRFLDFPVTNVNGEPMISSARFTNDLSSNSIPLSVAIKTCVDNAFQKHISIQYISSKDKKASNKGGRTYVLKNHNDPLFIHLRIQYEKDFKKNISEEQKTQRNNQYTREFLDKIAEIVGHGIKGRQYKRNKRKYLSTDVPLQKLQKKIILMVDITNISSIVFEESELKHITDLVVGQYSGVMMYPFQKLLKSVPENLPHFISNYEEDDDVNKKNTNLDYYLPIDQYTMAIPDPMLESLPSEKQVIELAIYHNVQFMPFMFYKPSYLLTDYMKLFQTKQNAFIPIQSLNQIYLKEKQQAIMR